MKKLQKGKILNRLNVKNIKKHLTKHKNLVIGIVAITILACVSIALSYAFLQTKVQDPILGGKVGKIADVDVRIMVQKRDGSGKGIEGYEIYNYIPQNGYYYNAGKSYCINGGTIIFKDNKATVSSDNNEICYLYFDANQNGILDVIINVYKEIVDENGDGTGTYGEKIVDANVDLTGYNLNTTKSSCNNNGTLYYDVINSQLKVDAPGKTTCNAYLDIMDSDVRVNLYLEDSAGAGTYHAASTIPNNVFYKLNRDNTTCTNNAEISVVSQKINVSTTKKTVCNAYLDITSGPYLEEVLATVNGKSITLQFTDGTIGTQITNWFYSFDGGTNYQSTANSTVTTSLDAFTEYEIKVYGADANGNLSRVVTLNRTTGYDYIGEFTFSSSVQTKTIEVAGDYLLEVWGASGGAAYNNATSYPGGKGGYSYGTVHLNVGDVLYVHTGGQGTNGATSSGIKSGGANGGGNSSYTYGGAGGGGTDIRINTDNLYSRVIVAGGGGGAGYYSGRAGGAGGGIQGAAATGSSYNAGAGTMIAGGAAGGYTKGTAGSFGTGGAAITTSSSYSRSGGGGGGWYGGGGGGYRNSSTASTYNASVSGGGGGSGWIFNADNYTTWSSTTEGQSGSWTLNSDYYLTDAETQSGNGTITFKSPTGEDETGHTGNGYARVTYIQPTS